MVAILMKDVFNLKEYLPIEDSRLAKSEFLHDEERRDEASETSEAVTKEASLKLTAAAEETDDVHAVANMSNFSGPTNLSIIIVFMLTVLIV